MKIIQRVKTGLLLIAVMLGMFNANGQTTGTTVHVGTQAGSSGSLNTHVGVNAGRYSTASNNSFFGYQSGYRNTSGFGNAFIGTYAGNENTTGYYNTFMGYKSGYNNLAGKYNLFLGRNSGFANTGGDHNIFLGDEAGKSNTTGSNNIFIGRVAGSSSVSGSEGVFIGYGAGRYNTTGAQNLLLGWATGENNTTGANNTFVGSKAGTTNTTGENNTYIGWEAGEQATGSNNVFLGSESGKAETGNHKLYISNSSTTSPLIYGEFDNAKLTVNGQMSIGTSNFPATVGSATTSNYGLYVEGGILTEELRVRTGWADYVFDKEYRLLKLGEVETYIKENGHLPNIPSANEVEESGISVGEITKLQQEKIEELTLYTIQQQKEIEKLKALVNQLILKD